METTGYMEVVETILGCLMKLLNTDFFSAVVISMTCFHNRNITENFSGVLAGAALGQQILSCCICPGAHHHTPNV